MHNSPLFSIITVTFNAEKEIGVTLKSLKDQTFKDFEHLVVDGASKDSTLSIIKDAGLPQSVILSEPDKGLYDAMNKALKIAEGKYVLFLNAGDSFFDEHTLQKYADAALKDFDIIYGDTCVVDKNGLVIGDRHLKAPEKLVFKSFSKGMLICHQAFMVKKEITQPYDLNYRFSADFDWCIKSISKTKPDRCHNLSAVTVRYLSAGMTDKNKIKSLKERFRIMCRHYGFPRTLINHFSFLFRALRRGSL